MTPMRDKTLATRADIAEVNRRMDEGFAQLRGEMRAGFAQLRAEIAEIRRSNQTTNRIGIGLLFALFVLVAQLIIGG